VTEEEFLILGRRSLLALNGLINDLYAATKNSWFGGEEALNGALTQIENLKRIRDVTGPRLLKRIEEGDIEAIPKFQRLIFRARESSQDIINIMGKTLSVSAFIDQVITASVVDVGSAAAVGVKKGIPLALGILALLIAYNVTKK